LKRELTEPQIRRILALFGSQASSSGIVKAGASAMPMVCGVDNPESGVLNRSIVPAGGCFGDDGVIIIGGGGTGGGGSGGGSADHKNYACKSRGTCMPVANYICTSNC